MKTHAINLHTFLSGALFSLMLAAFVPSAHAIIPVISSGETIVFSEDFSNNAANWTSVSVINGSGTAATTTASIGGSLWAPSIPGDGGTVTSTATLSSSLNIAEGPLSIYMRVRTDGPTSSSSGRFSIGLYESTGNRYFGLNLRPNDVAQVAYRNIGGTTVNTGIGRPVFANNSTFYDFKITLTLVDNSINNLATAEAFVYNITTSQYESLGIVSGAIDLDTGIFNLLQITSRNLGETTGAAYFDSVVITQLSNIPEPGTYALLVAGLTGAVVLARRRRV